MKKINLLFILFIALFLISCAKKEEEKTKTQNEETIVLVNPFLDCVTSYQVDPNETVTLPKSFNDINVTYSTESSDITINGNTINVLSNATGSIKVIGKWQDFTQEFTITINDYAKESIVIEKTSYDVKVNQEFEISFSYVSEVVEVVYEFNSNAFTNNNNKFIALREGNYKIVLEATGNKYEIVVNVSKDFDFEIENFEIYIDEEVELPITIIEGDSKDIVLSTDDKVISINGLNIKGISEGVAILNVTMGDKTKVVEVNVKDLEILVLNESLDVDYFNTLELEIVYPEFLNENLVYNVSDESVLKVVDGICYPNKIGKTRIKITLEEHTDISKSIIVNVTVDPVAVMKSFLLDEVKMIKVVKTYGSTVMEQSLLGSVSKYYFGDLNLIEKIVPLSTTDYVDSPATEELLKELDETGLIRTGIKHTETKYITYHDTANNTAGADAENHWKYLIGDYNKNNRARSWHYTVDDKCVIQNIPDDEVTWQGDNFIAYSQSIGIETCINYGINLDIVWHRMGKLCSRLMEKYHLDMSAIIQHNGWNNKDCPHTLRANGLFSYALDMIEAEWIAAKCLSGYTITFESLTPDYLDNTGQIKRAPEVDTLVSFRITITNAKGYNESFESSVLVKPLH